MEKIYSFLSISVDELVKTLENNDFEILKKKSLIFGNISVKNWRSPSNFSLVLMIMKKPGNSLKKKDFSSVLEIGYLNEREIEKTEKTIEIFDMKNGGLKFDT